MSRNTTRDLLHAIVDTMAGPDADIEGWDSMSMILEFPGGSFNEAHGFLYSADGTISAVASDALAIKPTVTACMQSQYEAGDALPVQALVQLNRRTGRYTVTFEDHDDSRWRMTPRNRTVFSEELRPALD